MATRNARKRYKGVDIDAVVCVDLGHHWAEVFFGHSDGVINATALRGIPIRLAVCETCHSQKLEYVGWDGRVISRRYAPADAYITNARALTDVFYERRKALREAKLERLKIEGDRGVGERWHDRPVEKNGKKA